MLFQLRFFSALLRFFVILARFWEAPGAQKINKKSKKSRSGRFWNAFGIQYRFWTRFGSDFGGFWKDFGWILEGFWEDFWKDFTLQTMIRATKRISMLGNKRKRNSIKEIQNISIFSKRYPLFPPGRLPLWATRTDGCSQRWQLPQSSA